MKTLDLVRHVSGVCELVAAAVLLRHGPGGLVVALGLAALAAWMWRGSVRAHKINSLLVPFPMSYFLAFRSEPDALLLTCLCAGAFVASLLYVRGTQRRMAAPA